MHRLPDCSSPNRGATRLAIPADGTQDDLNNPSRVAPRNLFDLGFGVDNLLRGSKNKVRVRFSVINLTNKEALYNFLSTFSGTHFVTPRAYQVQAGISRRTFLTDRNRQVEDRPKSSLTDATRINRLRRRPSSQRALAFRQRRPVHRPMVCFCRLRLALVRLVRATLWHLDMLGWLWGRVLDSSASAGPRYAPSWLSLLDILQSSSPFENHPQYEWLVEPHERGHQVVGRTNGART